VESVHYPQSENLDLAVVMLKVADGQEGEFYCRSSICAFGPKTGDRVIAIGYPRHTVLTDVRPKDLLAEIKAENVIRSQEGMVTETFSWFDDRYVRAAGFRMDKHLPSGMSGGAVFLNPLRHPVACGMVSFSSEAAKQSSATNLSPALYIPIPVGDDGGLRKLSELLRRGSVHDISNGPRAIALRISK
jgi:hypothetical protein